MNTRASRAAVFWSFAAIYILWGSTYLAIRVVVTVFPPFLASGSRFLLAGGLLYAWARWRGAPAPDPRLWLSALLFGGLFFLVGNGAVSWAETRLPSGLAALLAATSPLFTAVFESAHDGWRRPALRVIIGIVAGLGGVALLVAPGEFIGGTHADLGGAAAITIGALGWAAGSVRSHHHPIPGPAELTTGMKMLMGGVLLTLLSIFLGEPGRITAASLAPKVLLSWSYLVIFGSLIGFSAFTYLLRVTTPQKVTTSAFVNPLVAVALGWLILGEAVTPRTLVAAAVIIGAVVLIRVKTDEPQEP